MGAFDPNASLTHTVTLTSACSHSGTDAQGHPICRPDNNGGSNTSSFTISPKPSVAVTYSGPDEQGHGTAHISYAFPYNQTSGGLRVFIDGAGFDGPWGANSGTWDLPFNFTCGTPGAHQIQAYAYSCEGHSPTVDPSNQNFIDTKTTTATVAGQTTVSGSYDADTKQLTVTTHFANTDYYTQRGLSVLVDGSDVSGLQWTPAGCNSQVDATCTTTLGLSCGVIHEVKLVAKACNRTEAMYNAEYTVPAVMATPICERDSTGCHSCPSTGPECGVGGSNSCPTCGAEHPCPGNPMNVGSGDVSVNLPLFTIGQEPTPLRFDLTFHSAKPTFPNLVNYPLGMGWTHTFNSSIQTAVGTRLFYYTPTGNRVYFDQVTSTLWSAARPAFIADVIIKDVTAGTYTVKFPSGGNRVYSIATGKWVSASDRWGNSISGTYDGSGNLTTITDSVGRQITLEYVAGTISRIVLPGGAAWTLNYTALATTRVLSSINDPVNPSQIWRSFNYITASDGVYRNITEVRDNAGKLLEWHDYDQ
ncbi:MAG: RHS repeat protein, partial [Acidobacteriota bacterium]|nr:RHS repeat protein [Acidobacteriota bacterium]